jgi:hypothetical protein
MKVISFSLWGNDQRFIDGAVANAKLAQQHYPGWACWIYCATDVSLINREVLEANGFLVTTRSPIFGLHDGLFWRFEPASDPEVEMFVSRDLDSRINPREAAAVHEWIASGKRLHTMRDHYEHIVPILGGMWGCRHWPAFTALRNKWVKIGKMGHDQDFLKESIWPMVRDNDAVAHDLYVVDTEVSTPNGPFVYKPIEFFGQHDLRPFPPHDPLDPILHGAHVGARV